MKKTAAFAILILILVGFAFGEGSVSIREALPSASTQESLPIDAVIGQIAQTDSSETHAFLHRALTEEYSFEWTETYLREDVRATLVTLFGPWLSENLPASGVLMSVSHANPDGSTGVNVRVGDSCMAFIVSDGFIVSMRALV